MPQNGLMTTFPAAFNLQRLEAGLAFAAARSDLEAVLLDGGPGAAVVVQAPPGTGKTTLVPPAVANIITNEAAHGRRGTISKVVVMQPRRVAARSAARRLADLDGSPLGHRVGFTIRGEQRAGADTLVEFVTPGILIRRLLADPGLPGIGAVVLDEVHERGLESGLLFGMLGEVRELRGDLRLIAMSATLEAAGFAALLGVEDGASAPVVDCRAPQFPLAVEWNPPSQTRIDERGITKSFLDHIANTAVAGLNDLLAAEPDADCLVFVPGAGEVAAVAQRIRSRCGTGLDVLELHGQVPAALQDAAVSARAPGGLPRVIVSTALAESSLTVPGVRLVIDSGLSREPRRDAGRGMTGLVTMTSSKASAHQRAGRAARQGPGRVIRCYSQQTFAAAPAYRTPEAAVADLTSAALVLACWGAPAGVGLRMPDPFPVPAMEAGITVLRGLGALGSDGRVTSLGQKLAAVPADPRWGRALVEGSLLAGPTVAADVVAAVTQDTRPAGADLPAALGMLRSGKDPAGKRWRDESRRFRALIPRERGSSGDPEGESAGPRGESVGSRASAGHGPGTVVALAFPERVARRIPGTEQYLLASGTRAGLPVGSGLAGNEWLAIAELSLSQARDAAGTGAIIRSAAALSEADALTAAAGLVTERVETVFANGKITARRMRSLGALVLSTTTVRATRTQARNAVGQSLQVHGLDAVGWSESAQLLRDRLAFLHRVVGEPWPDVSDGALLAEVDLWLGPELDRLAEGVPAAKITLVEPLRRLVPWQVAQKLDVLAPERLHVPSGSSVRLDYSLTGDGGAPVAAVKLQECFGLAESPRLADGRVSVLFHLLSPAGRPLAVTGDLTSFWSGPYAQVRAEMRGRYPRHPWPEDPWTAQATARTKRRGG